MNNLSWASTLLQAHSSAAVALVVTGLILLCTSWDSAPIWTGLLLIYTSAAESTARPLWFKSQPCSGSQSSWDWASRSCFLWRGVLLLASALAMQHPHTSCDLVSYGCSGYCCKVPIWSLCQKLSPELGTSVKELLAISGFQPRATK